MVWFVFVKIIFMSAVMTVCGGAVYFISEKCGRFFSKRMLRLLWMIPLVLSIVPVSFCEIGEQEALSEFDRTNYVSEYIVEKVSNEPTVTEGGIETENAAAGEAFPADREAYEKEARQFDVKAYKETVAALYFAAVAALIICGVFRRLKFNRLMKRTEGIENSEILEVLKKKLQVKRKIRLYSVTADCTPFAFGIISPGIAVPDGDTSSEIIMHELMHIKHNDLLYLLFLNFVKTVHFFNPFIYIFEKWIKKTVELACDEACSEHMGESERISYSKKIIELSAPMSLGLGLSENGRNVKERVENVMNYRKRSAFSKALAVFVSIFVIFGQTAAAMVINNQTPVKAYIINSAREVYSVYYMKDGKQYHSGTSGRLTNRATLVNAAFYKGFSAQLGLELAETVHNHTEETETINANIEIIMDKFLKEVYGGRVWQGRFTVTVNDEIVMERVKGYINNVPGDYNRDRGMLYIGNANTYIYIYNINFDLENDSIINSDYEKEALETFETSHERYLTGEVKAHSEIDGIVHEIAAEEHRNINLKLLYNEKTGDLVCKTVPVSEELCLMNVPGGKYIFENDSVTGGFLLQRGALVLDEICGTLSGLTKNKMTFKSADKNVNIEMTAWDDESLRQFETGQYEYLENKPHFERTMKTSMHRRTLSELPFTLRLNEDKTKVIFRLKDGFNPEEWYYSYASYIGENDVYNKYHSKYGSRETELELSTSFGTHNLQFTYYNTLPYAHISSYDVLFKIVDGKILYHNAAEYITENKNYSGKEAFKEMEPLMWLLNKFED